MRGSAGGPGGGSARNAAPTRAVTSAGTSGAGRRRRRGRPGRGGPGRGAASVSAACWSMRIRWRSCRGGVVEQARLQVGQQLAARDRFVFVARVVVHRCPRRLCHALTQASLHHGRLDGRTAVTVPGSLSEPLGGRGGAGVEAERPASLARPANSGSSRCPRRCRACARSRPPSSLLSTRPRPRAVRREAASGHVPPRSRCPPSVSDRRRGRRRPPRRSLGVSCCAVTGRGRRSPQCGTASC